MTPVNWLHAAAVSPVRMALINVNKSARACRKSNVTFTMNVPVAELARVSTDVQFTFVVPIANVDPDAGEHTTGRTPSTRSAADAANVTGAPAKLVALVLMLAGSARTGAVVSPTVTLNEADVEFAWASIAVHITAVVPNGKVDPDAGTQRTDVGPSTRSLADALKLTATPLDDAASFVTFAGTVTVGGVVSTTVIENDPDP